MWLISCSVLSTVSVRVGSAIETAPFGEPFCSSKNVFPSVWLFASAFAAGTRAAVMLVSLLALPPESGRRTKFVLISLNWKSSRLAEIEYVQSGTKTN